MGHVGPAVGRHWPRSPIRETEVETDPPPGSRRGPYERGSPCSQTRREPRGPTLVCLQSSKGEGIAVRLSTPVKLRELQRKLYVKSKREPGYRFYTLYDKIGRRDVLEQAWRLVRANGGAAGLDGMTLRQAEAQIDALLVELQQELRTGTDRPQRQSGAWTFQNPMGGNARSGFRMCGIGSFKPRRSWSLSPSSRRGSSRSPTAIGRESVPRTPWSGSGWLKWTHPSAQEMAL